ATTADCTITMCWSAAELCCGSKLAISKQLSAISLSNVVTKEGLPKGRPFFVSQKLAQLGSLDDLAGLQAGSADANALVGAVDAGAHRPKIDVPAAAAHVVRVADLVSKLRAFAADVANLCHLNDSRY